MANVNLKIDFKNGDTLMDYQLNNNFAAIQEALKTMNAIMWQDNSDKVITFRGTTEELMNREIIDGQILYDTLTGESYIDYEGKRISTGSGNAIHIGENEPTNNSTQLWIPSDEFSSIGTEVVNSLEGNEERMAPSVAAVNEGINKAVTENYSTEETFTGKYWIDGKKIYKKTITGITSTGTKTHNISNFGEITDFYGHIIKSNGRQELIPRMVLSNPELYGIAVGDFSTTGFYIEFGSNYTNVQKGVLTLEYTKTTDTVEESEG